MSEGFCIQHAQKSDELGISLKNFRDNLLRWFPYHQRPSISPAPTIFSQIYRVLFGDLPSFLLVDGDGLRGTREPNLDASLISFIGPPLEEL